MVLTRNSNVAPAHTFACVPEGISFVDAATLPCAALTAYCALYRRLHIREGDIVLVHAAAGGVGGFAVQLAKAAKAFVIGTCSAPNAKYVRELGADEVFNYRSEDVFQRAKAIAGERGIDAIIDNIGPSNGVDNLALLGPEGGLACIAGIPDLSVVPDIPYSISIHDIGLGGVIASPAARGFGSNCDRADDAGTGREDQTNRCGTNYIGSNSESIGTTGRGARPRQNSGQSGKLIRVSVGHDGQVGFKLPGRNAFARGKLSASGIQALRRQEFAAGIRRHTLNAVIAHPR
jgi:hypothetical protein